MPGNSRAGRKTVSSCARAKHRTASREPRACAASRVGSVRTAPDRRALREREYVRSRRHFTNTEIYSAGGEHVYGAFIIFYIFKFFFLFLFRRP